MRRIRSKGRGRWVCTPKDFLDLGSRAAVDQALSRLVRSGDLRRIGRGLYDLPRVIKVLGREAAVDLDLAIAALSRRDGVRIMPDGMETANRLGLTNAVAARPSYVTDGSTRTIRIGGRTVHLRHARPSVMSWAGRKAAPVAQALRWMGPDAAAGAPVGSILRRRLPDDVKADLLDNQINLPPWAIPIARDAAGERPTA